MEYETYTSTVEGFAIDYPKKWMCVKNSGYSSVMFTPSPNQANFNLNVCVQDLRATCTFISTLLFSTFIAATRGQIPTPQEFLQVSIDQVKEMGAKGLEYGSVKIGVDNIDGYYMNYGLENPQGSVAIRQGFFQRENFTFVITLSVPTPLNTPDLVKVHQTAIRSFRLFTARGYKVCLMSPNIGECQIGNNHRFAIYSPKQWKTIKTSQTNQYHWKSDKQDNLHMQSSVDKLQAPIDTALKFNHWIKEEMQKKAIDGKVQVSSQSEIEHFIDLSGLENVKYSAIKLFFSSNTMEIKGDYEMVYLIVEDTVFTFTLITGLGENKDWSVLLESSVGALKLIEESADNSNKKTPAIPKDSILTYNLFVNIVGGYRVLIPKHFEVFEMNTNYYETVMFYSTLLKQANIPVFSINVEDLGVSVILPQYKGVIAQMMGESLDNARVLSDKPSRLDNYQASITEIHGFDSTISSGIVVALFKCAVIKRRVGVLISLRTAQTEYEALYKSSIFAFDTFKILGKQNNSKTSSSRSNRISK
ncbi:hypothetical protein DFA_05563 [Cavenderia fasciculata]|uniref:Uncharacterized protein n=1 Tax=Cavenderia fasciculata TaxID=261658 RepID=F4PLK9_CACFS|nr:uncharacterized protein DFA_05563 [Cavenderia fasciculata]EGG23431.1 hypothetical protein DFA_05563 [Cavenderia fasciculata]|eukprot:XP_004361282.1 hypothetical protein DFA_05563 [Cavenderia fasciculata]